MPSVVEYAPIPPAPIRRCISVFPALTGAVQSHLGRRHASESARLALDRTGQFHGPPHLSTDRLWPTGLFPWRFARVKRAVPENARPSIPVPYAHSPIA